MCVHAHAYVCVYLYNIYLSILYITWYMYTQIFIYLFKSHSLSQEDIKVILPLATFSPTEISAVFSVGIMKEGSMIPGWLLKEENLNNLPEISLQMELAFHPT